MLKKLLLLFALALILMFGFALVPGGIAHADECNGTCGQDPVQAGCASSQYIKSYKDFTVQNQTWEIRLRASYVQTSACINKVWASLVLVKGSNPNLYNSQDIQVYTTFQYDILPSSHFGSGAYTNMLIFSNNFACAQYDGNGISPPPAACFSN